MIVNNKNRVDKKLVAFRGSDRRKPIYYNAIDNIKESQWVAGQIAALVKGKLKYRDIAILVRSIYTTRTIETALQKEKIPYRIVHGLRFFERKEIKDALSFLRLIVDGDDLSFMRVINEPPRGIGKTRIAFLKDYAKTHNTSLFSALKDNLQNRLFARSARRGLNSSYTHENPVYYQPISPDEFVDAIEKLQMRAESESVSDLLADVLRTTGYESYLLQSGDDERKDNISELKASILETERDANEHVDIHDYLNSIAIYCEKQENESDNDVRIMTIHSSKGMEFPYVFMPFFNEQILPSRKAHSPSEIEEERRVAYVAMTRAENRLFISSSNGCQLYSYLLPSRFLLEIEYKLLRVSGVVAKSFWEKSKTEIDARLNMPIDATFSPGDRVFNSQFKSGTVDMVDRDAVVVSFDSGERKRILSAALARQENSTPEEPHRVDA